MDRTGVAAAQLAAANWVIGPVFVHGIASRTLAGIAGTWKQLDRSSSRRGNPAGRPPKRITD